MQISLLASLCCVVRLTDSAARTAAARAACSLHSCCTHSSPCSSLCPCRLSVINLSRGMSIQMSTGTVHMYVRAPYNRSTIDGRP